MIKAAAFVAACAAAAGSHAQSASDTMSNPAASPESTSASPAASLVSLALPASSASTTAARGLLRGIPTGRPVQKQSVTPAALTSLVNTAEPQLLQAIGAPKCTVGIASLGYHTIGGHGEPTVAETAVMLPSGAGCTGPHPVVLVAHGTSSDKNDDQSNLAGDIDGEIESLETAAVFAAQGYIVVMPNYAGYAGSSLPYAPFLNGDQQAADMIDALRAARLSYPEILRNAVHGKLYVTGYSQGGYVAMATLRAMQRLPLEFHPAAVATGSGPYALSLTVDKEIEGAPSAQAPLLFDLLVDSYQASYGNVFAQPGDVFAAQYATRAPGLLPGAASEATLFADNVLPENALFQSGSLPPPDLSNPDTAAVNQAGFDPRNFFLSTSYRAALTADIAANPCSERTSGQPIANCKPASGLRQDALRNTLLDFRPRVPLLMCGAHSDAVVYFQNTQVAAQYFQQHGVRASQLTVVDVDPGTAAPAGPFAALQGGFAAAHAQDAAALAGKPGGALQLESDVHVLAAPFCALAARSFFDAQDAQ
jgi:hypothetical protein